MMSWCCKLLINSHYVANRWMHFNASNTVVLFSGKSWNGGKSKRIKWRKWIWYFYESNLSLTTISRCHNKVSHSSVQATWECPVIGQLSKEMAFVSQSLKFLWCEMWESTKSERPWKHEMHWKATETRRNHKFNLLYRCCLMKLTNRRALEEVLCTVWSLVFLFENENPKERFKKKKTIFILS